MKISPLKIAKKYYNMTKYWLEMSQHYSTLGEGAYSTHHQIVFFITSIRDAAEQQNLATLH